MVPWSLAEESRNGFFLGHQKQEKDGENFKTAKRGIMLETCTKLWKLIKFLKDLHPFSWIILRRHRTMNKYNQSLAGSTEGKIYPSFSMM